MKTDLHDLMYEYDMEGILSAAERIHVGEAPRDLSPEEKKELELLAPQVIRFCDLIHNIREAYGLPYH